MTLLKQMHELKKKEKVKKQARKPRAKQKNATTRKLKMILKNGKCSKIQIRKRKYVLLDSEPL